MTNVENETRRLILDTASKIYADHCDKALLDAAETGIFAQKLWSLLGENGFTQLGSAASGTDTADMYAFIMACGRYAVPLPIADTLLFNSWCGDDVGVSAIGVADGFQDANEPNLARRVHWGRMAQRVIAIDKESHAIVVGTSAQVLDTAQNMAGEPCDVMQIDEYSTLTLDDDPFAQVALSRVNLMAGCLQSVLDLGLQFASERVQFGRSISKFQAIQHSLAVVASEVAAARRAADAAVDALGSERFVFEVAASKARVGEAVGVVAEQVHQVHGAMGFTHEHRLHHFTRRLWAWRDEWGNEFHWQALLGQHLAQLGADQVWSFIATRD